MSYEGAEIAMTRTRIDSFIIGFLYPAVLGVFLFNLLDGFSTLNRHWSYGVLPLLYLCTQYVEADTSKNRKVSSWPKQVTFFVLELVEMTMFYQLLVSLGLAKPVLAKTVSFDPYFYALAIMLIIPVFQRLIRGFKTSHKGFCKTILSLIVFGFALAAAYMQNETAECVAMWLFAIALVWYAAIIYSYNKSKDA